MSGSIKAASIKDSNDGIEQHHSLKGSIASKKASVASRGGFDLPQDIHSEPKENVAVASKAEPRGGPSIMQEPQPHGIINQQEPEFGEDGDEGEEENEDPNDYGDEEDEYYNSAQNTERQQQQQHMTFNENTP